MTGKDLVRLKKYMEDMKAELVVMLRASPERLAVTRSPDDMDRIRNLADLDLESRTIDLMAIRLSSLDAQLQAIKDGSFGRCVSCEEKIPLKRLRAIPWSTSCTPCQEKHEALHAGADARSP